MLDRARPFLTPRPNHAGAAAAPLLTPIRCLVVDDHPAIRLGLRELLSIEPGFEVLDTLVSAEAAVGFAKRTRVDVAIVDYQLGGRSGLWLSRQLSRLPDPPAVLVYSAFSDYLLAAACVVAQANGLVGKAALGHELCDRVREAARGETRLPTVPPWLADSMRRRLDYEEQTIFGMMVAGIPLEEVGRTLDIASDDLDLRIWGMLRKLERIER